MKPKHTPGPWKVESNEEFIEIWNNNTWIANVQTEHKHHTVDNFANARLIAAAPELLDALEDAITFLATDYGYDSRLADCLNKARAAKAKATGGPIDTSIGSSESEGAE